GGCWLCAVLLRRARAVRAARPPPAPGGGRGVTRPADSTDKQNPRKFARRVDPASWQLRRAADRSYAQLLDELRTFVDTEEDANTERTSARGASRSGRDRSPSGPMSAGRKLAKSVAVIVTALSLLSFLSGYLVANHQLDVPLFPQFWDFGRSFFSYP